MSLLAVVVRRANGTQCTVGLLLPTEFLKPSWSKLGAELVSVVPRWNRHCTRMKHVRGQNDLVKIYLDHVRVHHDGRWVTDCFGHSTRPAHN